MINDVNEAEDRAPALPWRRLTGLLRPIRGGLAVMVALSTSGVLIGLAPPLALGTLVNALVDRDDTAEATLMAGWIALAIIVETIAYVLSDGMFARNAGRLYRSLRMLMFEGARRPSAIDEDEQSGLPSRFISDAETAGILVTLLDSGAMQVVEFTSAIVVLGLLAPWTVLVVAPVLAVFWFVTRRMQEPAALAGQRRQEELEHMTRSITRELARRDDPESTNRFKSAVDRVMAAEIRYGWLQAVNLQGSGGLAKVGPIAAVVTAAFTGIHQAGTLIAVYLLAQRAFWGFDGLIDLSLDLQSVRGAVARCFALIDARSRKSQLERGFGSARNVPPSSRTE
jgi:ABC-type bacteriocin/lantibiotic exporter with double-glycine peptidase domain